MPLRNSISHDFKDNIDIYQWVNTKVLIYNTTKATMFIDLSIVC